MSGPWDQSWDGWGGRGAVLVFLGALALAVGWYVLRPTPLVRVIRSSPGSAPDERQEVSVEPQDAGSRFRPGPVAALGAGLFFGALVAGLWIRLAVPWDTESYPVGLFWVVALAGAGAGAMGTALAVRAFGPTPGTPVGEDQASD